jgi:hypothetical protein
MKINRNNYEPYFIDYLEGVLDENLVDDFLEFLLQNPDLKQELSLFQSVNLEPETISFDKKELLYKEKYDAENEFNQAVISNLEGDISAEEKIKFENYLATHPEKEKEITLFNATKLQPDETITFGKKNKLYRHSTGKTVLLWSVRIAAILVLIFSFYLFIDKSSTPIIPENQVAKLEEETPKKENPAVVNETPETKKKQEPEKIKSVTTKPVLKEVKPQQKPVKSLRETTKGRMEHEDLAEFRIPVEVPEELESITASLDFKAPHTRLSTMYIIDPAVFENDNDERLLADVVIEKTGLNKLSLNKITKAGLNLVTSISNEKFQYQTNNEGKIVEYNYDSRLLAFTIPTRNTNSGE